MKYLVTTDGFGCKWKCLGLYKVWYKLFFLIIFAHFLLDDINYDISDDDNKQNRKCYRVTMGGHKDGWSQEVSASLRD